MKAKVIITAAALAAAFIVSAHYFGGEHQLELFALFLALTACVYGGAALTPAGARFGKVEFPFVALVFVTAVLGLLISPVWIAVGYFAHGGWDLLHHQHRIATPVVAWFPPLCAVFDAVVGGFVLFTWIQL